MQGPAQTRFIPLSRNPGPQPPSPPRPNEKDLERHPPPVTLPWHFCRLFQGLVPAGNGFASGYTSLPHRRSCSGVLQFKIPLQGRSHATGVFDGTQAVGASCIAL